MSPYEQKMQQSAFFGDSSASQCVHMYVRIHLFIGIISSFSLPHSGQVIIDVVFTESIVFKIAFLWKLFIHSREYLTGIPLGGMIHIS